MPITNRPLRKRGYNNSGKGPKRDANNTTTRTLVILWAVSVGLIYFNSSPHMKFNMEAATTELLIASSMMWNMPGVAPTRMATSSTSSESIAGTFDPPMCTANQMHKILLQLPADECKKHETMPWSSLCSFSAASSCPETSWLDQHFAVTSTVGAADYDTAAADGEEEPPFVSFFVGCNKAIDAVNALRMGSRNNPKYDVQLWKKTLAQGREHEFDQSSCEQFDKPYNSQQQLQQQQTYRTAQVYCFEPVSSTFAQLTRTKAELGWTNKELVLEEAAVSITSGILSVPKAVPLGKENAGIENLDCTNIVGDSNDCRQIPVYTLNDYVGSIMPSYSSVNKSNNNKDIHFLSIDVEGYDFEVLKGASSVLDQVHYLEFEYNWKGPWAKQNLVDAVQMLHDDHGFICYWPGPKDGHLWRITGCWHDHYAMRFWANVACVNGKIPAARSLAERMEKGFLKTTEIEGLVYKRDPHQVLLKKIASRQKQLRDARAKASGG